MAKILRCYSRTSCWSNLSDTLIFRISLFLQSRLDILSFRGVCQKWRKHSIPLSLNTLNPLLPHIIESDSGKLVIAARSVFVLTPINDLSSSVMVMAEEVKPYKIQLRHPLSGKLLNHSATTLDLRRFEVSEVSKGHNLLNSNLCVMKVHVYPTSASLNDCAMFVLHDSRVFRALRLLVLEDSQCKWCETTNFDFDDVVIFQGRIWAVDSYGILLRVYDAESRKPIVFNKAAACLPVSFEKGGRRGRLVVDSFSDKLYYIVPTQGMPLKLRVYVLNQTCGRWDVVKSLGHYKVLFVGVDHCFFAWTRGFRGCPGIGNSVVFTDNAFPEYIADEYRSIFGHRYLIHDEGEEERIKVYNFSKDDIGFISDYPGLSELMRPSSEWFSGLSRGKTEETDSDSSSQQRSSSCSFSDDHEERMQLDSSSPKLSEASSSKGITDSDEDNEEVQMSSSNEQTCDSENCDFAPPLPIQYEVLNLGTSKMDYQKNGEGSGVSNAKADNVNSIPVTPTKLRAWSTATLKGIEIKSELLPTIQTIWEKHGSLIGEDTINNKHMRAYALELVAELVVTLQNTPAKNLTDSLADDIKSTLSDLQRVGLKVDWLVPAVEKTLAFQKHKPLIECIQRLNKRKAQVNEEEKQFLARTTKLKQKIEEDVACLSARIPPPLELLDPDDSLAGELLL